MDTKIKKEIDAWPNWKKKEYNDQFATSKYSEKLGYNCIECGETLKWGEFAYNQEMCWDCFESEVRNIIAFATVRDAKLIAYLLATTKEIHHRRK